jgi:NAD(P)-dependent dehydrogenase (short-subunit alcohol dehydrogenase family)
MGSLDGRVAIVTGGGLGLGRAHSVELARQGATVVIADPGVNLDGSDSQATPAEDVVAEIEAAGGTASAVAVSVTDFGGVGSLISGVVDRYGRLDIVVNNAGITRDRMVVGMEEYDWDDVLAVHLKGTFCLTRHAGAHWRALAKAGEKVSGRIINTTSGAGMQGNVGQSAYGTAKAGIAMFTIISSMELEQYGVTVNAISPVARTRMTGAVQGFLGDDNDGSFDPFDPANASPIVSYLASERAGWITGQVIRIDGNKLRHYKRSVPFAPTKSNSVSAPCSGCAHWGWATRG